VEGRGAAPTPFIGIHASVQEDQQQMNLAQDLVHEVSDSPPRPLRPQVLALFAYNQAEADIHVDWMLFVINHFYNDRKIRHL